VAQRFRQEVTAGMGTVSQAIPKGGMFAERSLSLGVNILSKAQEVPDCIGFKSTLLPVGTARAHTQLSCWIDDLTCYFLNSQVAFSSFFFSSKYLKVLQFG
jgi:hypothetical protein